MDLVAYLVVVSGVCGVISASSAILLRIGVRIERIEAAHRLELASAHNQALAAVVAAYESVNSAADRVATREAVHAIADLSRPANQMPTYIPDDEPWDPTDAYIPPLPAGTYAPELDNEDARDPGPFGYDDFGPDLAANTILTPAPWSAPVWQPTP